MERSRTSLGRCQKRASSGAAPGIPGAFGWRTRARRETGRRVLRARPALGQEKALLPPRGEEERRTLVRGLLGRLGVEVGFVGWSDTAVRELGGLALETKAGWGMPLYSFRERNGRRRLFFFFFKKEHPSVSELNTQILLQLIRLFRCYWLEILPLEFYSLRPQ